VFSKDNRNAYSFEGQFDSLMQCANYRETNGIVVGPEVSRIFAEIIFQDIDRKILRGLSKLRIGRDFAIRRYVDDYFIFANLEQHLDEIEMTVRRELERYKLFLNEKKISTSGRPFVSQITLARRDIRGIISEISRSFEGLEGCDDVRILRRQARLVQDKMLEVRLVVANYQVGFHTISGWLLTSLRGVLKSVGTVLWSAESQEQFDSIVEIIMGILRVIFYLVAMDLRVRTTYGVCQVISVVNSLTSKLDADRKDQLSHLIAEQLELLIGGLLSSDALGGEQADSVELYNLLICGAHNFGSTFLRRDAVGVALRTILDKPRFTYFGYITAKFCFLRDRAAFSEELAQLNTLMQSYVDRSFSKWDVDSETYLILCDYFSAPDISESDKCKLFNAVFHAAVSKRTMALLGKLVAYADWDGLRIEHLLARKELQPVYAWD